MINVLLLLIGVNAVDIRTVIDDDNNQTISYYNNVVKCCYTDEDAGDGNSVKCKV